MVMSRLAEGPGDEEASRSIHLQKGQGTRRAKVVFFLMLFALFRRLATGSHSAHVNSNLNTCAAIKAAGESGGTPCRAGPIVAASLCLLFFQ